MTMGCGNWFCQQWVVHDGCEWLFLPVVIATKKRERDKEEEKEREIDNKRKKTKMQN